MPFLPKSDKWLLVQKNSGDHEVIAWNRILPKHQRGLKIGSVIPVMVKENDPLEVMTSAKILASSQNHTILEEEIKKLNVLNPDAEQYFSASESEEDENKVKTRRHPHQRKRGKKILVPNNKANARIEQLKKKKKKIHHSSPPNSNNASTSQTYTNIPIQNNRNIRTYSNRDANILDIYRQSIKQMELKNQIKLKQTIKRINQHIMLRQEQIIDDMRDTVLTHRYNLDLEEETLEESRELDFIFGYHEQVGENSNFNQTTFQGEGSVESNRHEDNSFISNLYNSMYEAAALEVDMDEDTPWVRNYKFYDCCLYVIFIFYILFPSD